MWDSRDRHYADFFQVSSLDMVAQRVRHLSADDLQRQEWFIRASMTALSLQGHTIWSHYTPTVTDALASDAALIAAARTVGDHLVLLACGDDAEAEASWIGLSLAFERTWTLNAMGPDLYSGVAGMALFFAYLGDVTGEARYTTMAQRALGTLRRQVAYDLPDWINIGGFSEGGVLSMP